MTLSFTRRSLRSLATCALAAVAASSSPLAALEPEAVAPPQILPVDPTSCGHFWPAAALGPDGRALTAWATPGVGLRGRVLGASGIASGPEIALAPGGTAVPSLAAAPAGWVAAWVRGTGATSELVLQKLDRDAGAAGPVVPVTAEPLFVYPPALAVAANGTVVIAWVEIGQQPGPSSRVMFRRFGAGGGALGGPVVVAELPNPASQEHFARPSIALATDGGFVVGWSHVEGGWVPRTAHARGYAANGTPRGPARLLANGAFGPALAALSDGAFLAAWATLETPATLWVQRIDDDAEALAAPVPLQATVAGVADPSLAAGPGWVAVGWTTSAASTLPDLASVLLVDEHGSALGEPVALHPPLAELFPDLSPFLFALRLASDGRGSLVAAWQVGNDVSVLPSGCDSGKTVMAAVLRVGELAPPPPPGAWAETDELPGFRFQVRITATEARLGRVEARCSAETACFSGARRGRTEVLVRVTGPRPNGRLWPAVVRFTPSQVEVWVEQRSTGAVRYYLLPAVPPASDELPGLIDRDGFAP